MASQNTILDVQNVSKRFGARELFANLSFSIAEGQKVGLIARNGTGKSTLLSILTGRESQDEGAIVYRNGIRTGYLEQEPVFNPDDTVLDACFNHQGDDEKIVKAKQILTRLKIADLSQPMGQLSGGQRKRVALANALITEPDFLILDEPTNHLDLEMIEWLEGFLQRGNKSILMVTHDRYFLDRVCDVILELDDHTIIPIVAIMPIILRSVRSALTIVVPNRLAPPICIVPNWSGCAVCLRPVATKPSIVRTLSMNSKPAPISVLKSAR